MAIFPTNMLENKLTLDTIKAKFNYFELQMHELHWQTFGLGEHEALGSAYDTVYQVKDEVVEKIMGYSGVKLREEEKIRISNTLKKYYADNPEMRSKIGLRNLGKKMTSESLEKQLKTREIKKSNYRKVLEYKKSGEIIEHDGLKNIIKLYAESCNRLSKLDFLVFKERLFIYKDKVKENINYFEILKSFKILQNTRKINVENIKTNFIKQYDSIQEFCIEHNFTYCSVYTAIIKNRIYRKEFLIKRYERTNK